MPGKPARERKGLAFATGWCVGSAVRAARGAIPGTGSRGPASSQREGIFKALLELYVGGIEGGSEQVNAAGIERVFERAAEIARLVLDSGPRGTRAEIAVDEIVAMDRLGGGRVSERAIRRNRHSIANFGLLNPLVVRKQADCFQLLQGRARLVACRRLGLGDVAVVVKEVGDTEAVELSLLDALLGNGASHVDPDCIRALLRFYARPSRRTASSECTGAASQMAIR